MGDVRRRRSLRPFTVEHFRIYCSKLVFDDGQRRDPEPWQLDFVRDVFRGYAMSGLEVGPGPGADGELLLLVPEGNGKTTFIAQLALYGCDWARRPWIPVGASTRDQAKVLYRQAKGFVEETPGLERRFRCFDGYRAIRPLDPRTGKRRPGEGIEICPWDPDSNDGAIPFPYFICDELHRHDDLSLWRLWKGKRRKRGAQGIGISTAGEPGSEFEELRDRVRERATSRRRRYGGVHYRGGGLAMYEFRLERPEQCMDVRQVVKVNPLSTVTADVLREDMDSPSFDLGDHKRLKCNIPARSSAAAITDDEWAAAASEFEAIPEGERIDAGLDVGWKHDTTAISPDWRHPDGWWLLDEAIVIVPPRDGSSLHPDRVKEKLTSLVERNPLDSVAMDTSKAEDVAAWIEDELGVTVVDHGQGNDMKVRDYNDFMQGLRNGTLRRVVRCPLLTRHAMNAIARRLPRGDYRFDRPTQSRRDAAKQDRRVIDALDAAAMVNSEAVAKAKTPDRPLVAFA